MEAITVGKCGNYRQRFQDLGMETFPSTPEAFRQHIAAEIAKWKSVIEKANIPRQ